MNNQSVLRIATRGSALALWQAEDVKRRLEQAHPDLRVELKIFTTQGDKLLDSPLAKIGGKGLFVKELEVAMLTGEADIAVHSMKDVPMDFPEGLGLAAVCEREDPTDAFVSNNFSDLSALPQGAIVGTSSLRRQCHIKSLRPDLDIKVLRGNVNTRLSKLDQGDYDAIILASAGLIRLGFAERITQRMSIAESLPAVGQGAVGVECRVDDSATLELLKVLHHEPTALRVGAERAMNKRLNGGCQVPIAGYAELDAGQLSLKGMVAEPEGDKVLSSQATAAKEDYESLGITVAEELLVQGAGAILDAVYASNGR